MDELNADQIAETHAVAQAAATAAARDDAIVAALRDPVFVGSLSLCNGMSEDDIRALAARALDV